MSAAAFPGSLRVAPVPAQGPASAANPLPDGRSAAFALIGALAGEAAGFVLRPLLDVGIGYALFLGLTFVGAMVGLALADRSRWKQTVGRWQMTVAGLVGAVGVVLCTAGVQWAGELGGIGWTICLLAWLGGVSGGVAGTVLTGTSTFNDRIVPWSLQPKRSPRPFPYTIAIPWALVGGTAGWLLAFLPRLLAPGGRGDAVALLNAAGLVLWTAVGAVGAVFYGRQVDLGEDWVIYHLLGALGGTLAWTLVLMGIVSLIMVIEPDVGLALLALLGAAGGVLLGKFVGDLDRVRRFLASLG